MIARSGYQSQNKDWGEMYEHELDACADELDAMIDGLIATDNAITAERDEWKRKYDEVNENYMGLVNLLLPYLRAAQERAIAEGRDNG